MSSVPPSPPPPAEQPDQGAPIPAPVTRPADGPAPLPPSPAAPDPSLVALAPPAPPPPPPAVTFDAAGRARALFSQLDPTGVRPTAIVAAVILALFFGSQLVNALIPQSAVGPGQPGPGGPGPVGPGPGPVDPGPGPGNPLPPGSSVTIGPLRIPVEGGWTPQEVPNSNIIVRLVKGGTSLDVFSASIEGQADPAAVYNFYMRDIQGSSTGFTASPPNLLQIGNGIPAARGSYTGVFGQSQVEGQVTAIALGADGFIFDTWSAGGTLGTLLPEAQRMIDNITVQ